jgi:hypothetical protein
MEVAEDFEWGTPIIHSILTVSITLTVSSGLSPEVKSDRPLSFPGKSVSSGRAETTRSYWWLYR